MEYKNNFRGENYQSHNFLKQKYRELQNRKKTINFADVVELTVALYQFRSGHEFRLPTQKRDVGESHSATDPIFPLPFIQITKVESSGTRRLKTKKRRAVDLHINVVIDILNQYYAETPNPVPTLQTYQRRAATKTQSRLVDNIRVQVQTYHVEAFANVDEFNIARLAVETLRVEDHIDSYHNPVQNPCVEVKVDRLGLPTCSPTPFVDQLDPALQELVNSPEKFRPDEMPALKPPHGSYPDVREHALLLDKLHSLGMLEWTREEPLSLGEGDSKSHIVSDFFAVRKLTPGSTELRLIQNLAPVNMFIDMRKLRWDPRIPTAEDLKFLFIDPSSRKLYLWKRDVSNCFHTLCMRGTNLQRHYGLSVPD